MATKAKKQELTAQENLQATVSKTESFYNENKKTIWTVVAAIAAVAALTFAYQYFILKPKMIEASQQTYPAEMYFQQGEFELAYKGDGNSLGFSDIISEYGSKAGRAVYFYAGVCCLKLDDFEGAVEYLKKYNGKDPILKARAKACLGDAYVGLEEYGKAAASFMDAASESDNVFAAAYLKKAADVYVHEGQNDKALKCYETIKDKYPSSAEGYDADRYIEVLKIQAE